IGDIMTDRSVRQVGRGPTSILARTAEGFYEAFCRGKVAFNYGFTTDSRRQRLLRGWQLELVKDVGLEFDDFFARVAPAYRFLVRRDARYLRWRYLDCPDVSYFIVAIRKWRRLVGWSVFGVRDSRLSWGDALFDPRY